MGKKYVIRVKEVLTHEIDLVDDTLTNEQIKLLEIVKRFWPAIINDDRENVAHLLDLKVDGWRDFPLDVDIEDVQVIEEKGDE